MRVRIKFPTVGVLLVVQLSFYVRPGELELSVWVLEAATPCRDKTEFRPPDHASENDIFLLGETMAY